MDATNTLAGVCVVPVVVLGNNDDAVPLAETLLSAGVSVMEITLRTTVALQAIEAIAKSVPEMTVGAGSLRTSGQVRAAKQAGAVFGVSPGASTALLAACEHCTMPFIPGAATPSESLELVERGYTLQKLFPAQIVGGIAYLEAIASPLPEVRFMPTGGITADLAPAYLSLPNVACIGGTWIVPGQELATKNWQAIKDLARAAAVMNQELRSIEPTA